MGKTLFLAVNADCKEDMINSLLAVASMFAGDSHIDSNAIGHHVYNDKPYNYDYEIADTKNDFPSLASLFNNE